jgi:hypothetical protein
LLVRQLVPVAGLPGNHLGLVSECYRGHLNESACRGSADHPGERPQAFRNGSALRSYLDLATGVERHGEVDSGRPKLDQASTRTDDLEAMLGSQETEHLKNVLDEVISHIAIFLQVGRRVDFNPPITRVQWVCGSCVCREGEAETFIEAVAGASASVRQQA